MKSINERLKPFMAEDGGNAGGEGSTTEPKAEPKPIEIDYNKLDEILAKRQSANEQSVIKGYLKDKGLDNGELENAIALYKEQREKNKPDIEGMKASLSKAKKEAIDSKITLEAYKYHTEIGVDMNDMELVMLKADTSKAITEDGKIDAEKLKEALLKVVEAHPNLKTKASETNTGIKKFGADGNSGDGGSSSDELMRKAFGL